LKLKEKKKEVEIRMVVHLLPECEGVLPSQKWRWENVKNKKKTNLFRYDGRSDIL